MRTRSSLERCQTRLADRTAGSGPVIGVARDVRAETPSHAEKNRFINLYVMYISASSLKGLFPGTPAL